MRFSRDTITITIEDDDTPIVSIADGTSLEGNVGGDNKTVDFVVTLDKSASVPVTVNYTRYR